MGPTIYYLLVFIESNIIFRIRNEKCTSRYVCLERVCMSEVYMLKNVDERTPSCVTPVESWR